MRLAQKLKGNTRLSWASDEKGSLKYREAHTTKIEIFDLKGLLRKGNQGRSEDKLDDFLDLYSDFKEN